MRIIEQTPDRLVFHDSPWGLRGMGAIFGGSGGAIVTFMVKGGHSAEHNAWVAYVVGTGFALIGIAMLLTAADRRVVFDATSKVARLITRGLFSIKTDEYPFANIRDIALEMQNMATGRSNQTSVCYRIVFVLRDGSRAPWTSLLTGDFGRQAQCVAAARAFGKWDSPSSTTSDPGATTDVVRRTPVYLNGVLSAQTPSNGVANVGLVAAFLGVVGLVGAVLMVMQVERLSSWRPVTATVLSSQVGVVKGERGGITYRPVVSYTYTVDGRSYTSNAVSVITVSQGYKWASAIAERYIPGSQVTAYVSPRNPRAAYLVHELSLLPLLIMMIPIAVGGMIYYNIRWSSRQVAAAVTANVPVLPVTSRVPRAA